MSADVQTMFSVRKAPWHGEGRVLADYPGSWAAARVEAGLEWDPIYEDCYKLTGMDEAGVPVYSAIDGFRQIVRNDTGATLSVQPNSYTLIDNGDLGMIVESILGMPNVKWETAGSLLGGKAVWCLVSLDEPIDLPGDNTVTLPYLAVTNSHIKRGGCTARATAVRIVCRNTFRLAEAEGERTGATFTFRHTANWKDRIEEARAAVTRTRVETAAYQKVAAHLLATPVTTEQRDRFITAFIPAPISEGVVSDRVAHNIEEARNAVRRFLASDTTAPVAHTAYGLLQAGIEYLDYGRRSQSEATLLGRTILRPEPRKARVLSLVREVVKA